MMQTLPIDTFMAKRKAKTKPAKETKPFFDDLSPHTKQAIVAVLLAALGLFFLFALLGYGGMVGDITATGLQGLLGDVGQYLAVVACGLYIYVFLRPREDESISTSKVLGSALFILSLLGMLELWNEGLGGMVGLSLAYPLETLVGTVVSWIFVVSLFLVGIFLTLNTGFRLPKREKDQAETESNDDIDAISVPEPETEAEDAIEPEPEPEPEKPAKSGKKSVSESLGMGGKESFVVSNFQGTYDPPPLSLLQKDKGKAKVGDIKASANTIKHTLKNFNISVTMDEVSTGPTVTRYALKPAEGVRISRIVGLQNNLEMALAASPIRIEAPIPGKSLVGIEVPNTTKSTIGLASMLASPEYTDSNKPLLVALGKDITGNPIFTNVAKMPHALIAGTTGSGKSVTIHNLILSLLFRNSPDQLRFIMVDPKRVELTLYNDIPHLLTPVITDAKTALKSLKWAIKEMERRYDVLQSEKVRDIGSYHEKIYWPAKKQWQEAGSNEEDKEQLPEAMPYIVIIIDELSDLMQTYPRELESCIVRLAQMSRAVGIHLLIATQRPEVKVITGLIKANVPSRIALKVASQIDSRTIIDGVGAEKLLGQGDMLFSSGDQPKPLRLQSANVEEEELKKVIDYLKKQDASELDSISFDSEQDQTGDPDAFFGAMVDDEEDDELYGDAKQAVIDAGKASTSFLQRKLRVGYSRAARLVDLLEERGVIGPADGAKPREILVGREDTPEDEEAADSH